jgi:transcriptional repressor NrdR
VRRRRECETCSHRFTTFERRAPSLAIVLKRDGRREEFDTEKLRAGLERAAHKLPAAEASVPVIAEIVELEAATGGVLPTKRIGELCLEGLLRADRVAYLRFASVHKQLDTEAIRDELVAFEPNDANGEAANGDNFREQTNQAEAGHAPDSEEQSDGRIHA